MHMQNESKKKGNKVIVGLLIGASIVLFSVLLGFESHYRGMAKDIWQERASEEEKADEEENKTEEESDSYVNEYEQGDVSF